MKRLAAFCLLLAVCCVLFAICCMIESSYADVPRTIHYQGRVTEIDGTALVGQHQVTIRLYDAETGGTKLWEESHTLDIRTEDRGIFSILLGSQVPLTPTLSFNQPLWLTIEVDGEGELLPRQFLSSVGYAINADTLDGLDSSQFLTLASGVGDITEVNAGSGLSGGAASGRADLNIEAGTGLIVGTDSISVDVGTTAGKIVQLDVSGALPAVSGNPLISLNASSLSTGTMDDTRLSSNVSLLGTAIETTEVTDGTLIAADTSDTFLSAGSGVTVSKGVDSWTIATSGVVGDVTGVTAGLGLTGGGSSGDVTLDIGAGTGILVAADSISVDVGTGANQIVQLDANGFLPAISAANLTSLNASNLTAGTVADGRLSSNVSFFGGTIESSEIIDGTLTASDTSETFLTAGSGVTIAKGLSSWDISATGSGGDITSVSAGSGLIGGGTSGDVTLALISPVAVSAGGTAATTATAARANLAAAASGANSDLTSLSGLTTPLSVAQGGTGASSLTTNGVLLGGSTLSATTAGSANQILRVSSGGGAPAFGAIDLSSAAAVTGTLPVGKGGTGTVSVTQGGIVIGQGTGALTTTGVLAKGDILVGDGVFDPTSFSAGSDGSLLRADSGQSGGLKWASGCVPIGGVDTASRNSTFVIATFGGGAASGMDALWSVPVNSAVSQLSARVTTAPGAGDSWTVTLRKNGSDTSLSCSIAGTALTCTTSGSVNVVVGDRLGVRFLEGGTAASNGGSGWSACLISD